MFFQHKLHFYGSKFILDVISLTHSKKKSPQLHVGTSKKNPHSKQNILPEIVFSLLKNE